MGLFKKGYIVNAKMTMPVTVTELFVLLVKATKSSETLENLVNSATMVFPKKASASLWDTSTGQEDEEELVKQIGFIGAQ